MGLFMRLVDRLPLPSVRTQRIIALAVLLSQALISVTGSIVRVTASGLGCRLPSQRRDGHQENRMLHFRGDGSGQRILWERAGESRRRAPVLKFRRHHAA